MSSAIWWKESEEWRPLLSSGFPTESALHDLVEATPGLLPLSGDPSLIVLGREVALGPGFADLVAVEPDGRLAVIEVKLRKNAEARRAVVAQILMYAAFLKTLDARGLDLLLRPHLAQGESASVADAVRRSDQSGEFDAHVFSENLRESLSSGAFRLVLVLDEAPSELVQLVGYLESITSEVIIDLITVSAFQVGDQQILVPQRVDPDYRPEARQQAPSSPTPRLKKREVDGSEAFEQAIDNAPPDSQPSLRRLLGWARGLEGEGLATLRTVLGEGREILLVWVRGEKAGLVSIWNDSGAYISAWRSVFVRLAPNHIALVEGCLGKPIGQGSTTRDPSEESLAAIKDAYRDAAQGQPPWNERDFYVSFGEGSRRTWDDARQYGFVSAGGGEWYSRSLQLLKPGHLVFVYIPKGSGVGGYVGVGEVTSEAMLAKDFRVLSNGTTIAYLDVANAPEAAKDATNPDLAEWVVPIRWIDTRAHQDALKDSDFFANQNSAVRLTHGYTQRKLYEAFGIEAPPSPSG